MKIDSKVFEEIDNNTIFASGIEPNSPDGVYMVSTFLGRLLLWVAVKGGDESWCIYIHWKDENNVHSVKLHGDKVIGEENIRKLVNCSDLVFTKYRR